MSNDSLIEVDFPLPDRQHPEPHLLLRLRCGDAHAAKAEGAEAAFGVEFLAAVARASGGADVRAGDVASRAEAAEAEAARCKEHLLAVRNEHHTAHLRLLGDALTAELERLDHAVAEAESEAGRAARSASDAWSEVADLNEERQRSALEGGLAYCKERAAGLDADIRDRLSEATAALAALAPALAAAEGERQALASACQKYAAVADAAAEAAQAEETSRRAADKGPAFVGDKNPARTAHRADRARERAEAAAADFARSPLAAAALAASK